MTTTHLTAFHLRRLCHQHNQRPYTLAQVSAMARRARRTSAWALLTALTQFAKLHHLLEY